MYIVQAKSSRSYRETGRSIAGQYDVVIDHLTAPKNQIGRLKNHFKHYAYDSIEQFIAKQNRYSSLGAKGAKSSKFKAVLNPAWTFFKLFFLKGGWREGWRGYVIARLYAQYTFWKYVK